LTSCVVVGCPIGELWGCRRCLRLAIPLWMGVHTLNSCGPVTETSRHASRFTRTLVVFHFFSRRVDHPGTLLLRMQPPVVLEYEPTQLKLDIPLTRIERCPPSSVAEDPINKTTSLWPELEFAIETEHNVQESTYNGPLSLSN
jgi:hypothetical protein